jgi:lipoprotein-anchoring transpeptidase ErfK/SrfK
MRSREWAVVLAAILGVSAAGFAEAEPGRPKDPAKRILISIPHRKLALIQDGEVVRLYDTAVGTAKTPSPVGDFAIVNRIPNPTYYAPGKVTGPGKSNPLGTRWMGLTIKGYGIHGTNVPGSIGKAASHGCIRMRNRDVEELFDLVSVGDRVELHGQLDEEVVSLFGELHRRTAPPPEPKKHPSPAVLVALATAAK